MHAQLLRAHAHGFAYEPGQTRANDPSQSAPSSRAQCHCESGRTARSLTVFAAGATLTIAATEIRVVPAAAPAFP